jgi:hypothetical protein
MGLVRRSTRPTNTRNSSSMYPVRSDVRSEATWYYQSQDGNHQQAHIVPYDKLQRDAPAPHYGDYYWPYPHFEILDWQNHEGWNE